MSKLKYKILKWFVKYNKYKLSLVKQEINSGYYST